MPGADCGSDHNPVVATMKIKLTGIRRTRRLKKWNVEILQNVEKKGEFQSKLDKQLQDKRVNEMDEIDQIWKTLKSSIGDIAEEICGKEKFHKKQKLMNVHILNMMEEKRKYKMLNTEEGQNKYKELKQLIQRLCREAKNKYFDDKCKEIELLDKAHSQLLYKKIKDLQPRSNRVQQIIKDKYGKSVTTKEEALKRWAEYVEELYDENNRR